MILNSSDSQKLFSKKFALVLCDTEYKSDRIGGKGGSGHGKFN